MRKSADLIRVGRPVMRRHIGVLVDDYLSKDDLAVLYQRWRREWGDPIDFGGGVYGIECRQILVVPEEDFLAVYGKQVGKRIYALARYHGSQDYGS